MTGHNAFAAAGLIWTVLAVVVVVAGSLVAYYTPLMSVRTTEVSGNRSYREQNPDGRRCGVRDAAASGRHGGRGPAGRGDRIGGVGRVQRSYPSALTITVVERRPVVRVIDGRNCSDPGPAGRRLPDIRGRGEGARATGVLPRLTTAHPGPTDPTTKAAVSVVAGLPVCTSAETAVGQRDLPCRYRADLTGDRR